MIAAAAGKKIANLKAKDGKNHAPTAAKTKAKNRKENNLRVKRMRSKIAAKG